MPSPCMQSSCHPGGRGKANFRCMHKFNYCSMLPCFVCVLAQKTACQTHVFWVSFYHFATSMFASAPGRGSDRSGGGPTESKIGDLGLYFPFSLVRKGPCRTQGQCAIVPGPSAVAFLGGCLRKKNAPSSASPIWGIGQLALGSSGLPLSKTHLWISILCPCE